MQNEGEWNGNGIKFKIKRRIEGVLFSNQNLPNENVANTFYIVYWKKRILLGGCVSGKFFSLMR